MSSSDGHPCVLRASADDQGAAGWELVTITSSSVTLITAISPQGNDGYGNFATHRLFFKRPVSEQPA